MLPSRDELLRLFSETDNQIGKLADAVLGLLQRSGLVELDEEELAKRLTAAGFCDDPDQIIPRITRAAIAYVYEKTGQGKCKAEGKGTSPLTPVASGSASDAPPAHDSFKRWAGDAAPVRPLKPHQSAPTPAERRAALVAKCKNSCCSCAGWTNLDDDPLWGVEVSHMFARCNAIRREIAALDVEETERKAIAESDAMKVAAPKPDDVCVFPAPDESLKAEALALCNKYRRASGCDYDITAYDPEFNDQWLALAREVRRQKAEELEAIYYKAITPRMLENAMKARIAELRGETDAK